MVMATAPSLLVLLGATPARHLRRGRAVPPCSASGGVGSVVAAVTRGARAPAGIAARGAGGRLVAGVSTACPEPVLAVHARGAARAG